MAKSIEAGTNASRTLAAPAPRFGLCSLAEQATPVIVDRLATRVPASHSDSDPDAVDAATLSEMRAALYHLHLPNLAEASCLEWAKDAHVIQRGGGSRTSTRLHRYSS